MCLCGIMCAHTKISPKIIWALQKLNMSTKGKDFKYLVVHLLSTNGLHNMTHAQSPQLTAKTVVKLRLLKG